MLSVSTNRCLPFALNNVVGITRQRKTETAREDQVFIVSFSTASSKAYKPHALIIKCVKPMSLSRDPVTSSDGRLLLQNCHLSIPGCQGQTLRVAK